MEALNEKILDGQLLKPDGIDQEDQLEEHKASERYKEKGLAAIAVRQRSCHQGEQDTWQGLQHLAVGLDLKIVTEKALGAWAQNM